MLNEDFLQLDFLKASKSGRTIVRVVNYLRIDVDDDDYDAVAVFLTALT